MSVTRNEKFCWDYAEWSLTVPAVACMFQSQNYNGGEIMYLVYVVDYFQTSTFIFLYTFCDLVRVD